jgi:hypothetical protein
LFCLEVFFGSTGFELKALCLLVTHSSTGAIFCFGYFWDRVSWFMPGHAWTLVILFILLHHSWDDKNTPSCPDFLVEMGSHKLFFSVLGFELRAYTLSHSTSPFLWRVFWDRFSWTILPGLASNHDPPDLCPLSSWNYRREPLAPSSHKLFVLQGCHYLHSYST